MRLNIQDDSYTRGYIDHVELQNGKDLLSYSVETLDDRYAFVWKKEGEEAIRLYRFEDATKHVHYVQDGVIPNTAIATPVYHHCRQSVRAPGQAW